jgi:hypothetical protein
MGSDRGSGIDYTVVVGQVNSTTSGLLGSAWLTPSRRSRSRTPWRPRDRPRPAASTLLSADRRSDSGLGLIRSNRRLESDRGLEQQRGSSLLCVLSYNDSYAALGATC